MMCKYDTARTAPNWSYATVGQRLGAVFLVFWFAVGLTACKKDPGPVSPENRAPGSFSVTVVPAPDAASISWTEAVDPDGDTVAYTLIVESDTLLAASADRAYEASGLQPDTEYDGVVVASDRSGSSSRFEFFFTTEIVPNRAPGAFTPTTPADGAVAQVAPLQLSWTAAVDPDGDPVVYEVLFDGSLTPSTSIASDLATTSFSFPGDALVGGQTYFWQVVARDGNGGETASPVTQLTMRTLMILATDAPGWGGRGGHVALSFQDRIWVMGGFGVNGFYGDVWSSADGVAWQEEVADAPWGARTRTAGVVFDGKIWIIGGVTGYNAGELSDVWSSSDGINWTQVTPDAGFSPRFEHYVVAHDGKLWVIGGRDYANTAEVRSTWSSPDGINWTQEAADAGRNVAGRALTHDGRIWHLGGFAARASWTTNGADWTDATNTAAFGERVYPAVAAHDGKMWLISGSDNAISQYNELPDIWSSADGVNWALVSNDAGFNPVAGGQAVSHQGKLWLLGGGGGFGSSWTTDDVWVLE